MEISNLLDETDKDIESIVLKRFEHELVKNNRLKHDASFEKETLDKHLDIVE